MPFKGDRRLGGPHDNERTLNGTSSDFDSVPAYGTFLHGPEDTSRTEYDFVGASFYMPYETNYYADGLGGEYPVEVWGLQYLPAGWVTNRVETGNSSSFDVFYDSGVIWFTYSTERTDYIEDGTGINYESTYNYGAEVGDLIVHDTYFQENTLGPEVDVEGVWYWEHRAKTYYYYDGNGGYYTEPQEIGPWPSNTFIRQVNLRSTMPPVRYDLGDGEEPHMSDYYNGKYQNAYWDGSGGYTLGPPLGSYYPNGTTYYTQSAVGTITVEELSGQGIDDGSEFYNGIQTSTYFKWNGSGGSGTTTSIVTGNYYPNETYIGTDGSYNYYHNGTGGYYSGVPCIQDEFVISDQGPAYTDPVGPNDDVFVIGTRYFDVCKNADCSQYESETSFDWLSNGTEVGSYLDGNNTTQVVYSDGNGGWYIQPYVEP